jgi:hypothetical protein
MMDSTLNGLLYSRKFWLAVFAVVQSVVLHYLNVPDDIWQAIAALVGVLIASIAVEDSAKKTAQAHVEAVRQLAGASEGEELPY